MSISFTRNDVKKARDEIMAACPGALVEDWQDYGYKLTVADTTRSKAIIVMQPDRPEIGQYGVHRTAADAIAWWRSL